MHRRIGALVVATLFMAACTTPSPVVVHRPTPSPKLLATSPGPSASIRPSASPLAGSPTPAPTTPPVTAYALAGAVLVPASVIANNGAGLLTEGGLGLVANNGSNLIGDNGGSLIANNGAGLTSKTKRHLLAVEQSFLTGALVELVGADGKPLTGADGKPLQARTDATGRYSFPVAPSGQAVVVVRLPGTLGTLQAIAPRGTQRTANLELTSTLTTAYILTKYVTTQKEPVKVLDRLPDDVEAATRAKANAAIAAGSFTPPNQLDAERLVAAVEQLRGANKDFDGQMEAVKKILVVAGQSNLGNGLPALTVPLKGIKDVAVGADGTVYFESLAGDDAGMTNLPTTRLWALAADGTLVAVAGNGQTLLSGGAGVSNGAKALEVACHGGVALGLDQAGQPIFETDQDKAYRAKADGTLEELYDAKMGVPAVRWVGADPTGEAAVLTWGYDLLVVDAPGKTRKLATLGAISPDAHVFGRDTSGRFYAATSKRVVRLEPATGTQAVVAGSDKALGVALAASGHVLLAQPDGSLQLVAPDGSTTKVLDKVPADFKLDLDPLGVAPDGKVYLVQGGTRLFRIAANKLEAVAGQPAGQITGGPNAALDSPTSLDLGQDGTLYIADSGKHQVLAVKGGLTSVVAGTGTAAADGGDGGKATAATFGSLLKLRRDATGNIYLLDSDGAHTWLRRIKPDGNIESLWDKADPSPTMAVANNGDVLVARSTTGFELRKGEAAFTPITGADAGIEVPVVDVEADATGGFLVTGGANVVVRTFHYDGSGLARLIGTYASNALPFQGGVDPTGRFFFPHLDSANFIRQVVRFDVAGGKLVPVAGQGAPLLNGGTTDGSLQTPVDVRFDATGNMYVLDNSSRQVKQVPATALNQ